MKKSFQWRSFHRLSVRNTATLPREGKEQIHRGTPHSVFRAPAGPLRTAMKACPHPPRSLRPCREGSQRMKAVSGFLGFFGGAGREEFLFCFVCVVLFCFQLEIKGCRDCTGLRKFSFSPSAGRGPRSPLPSQRECGPSGWLSKPNSGRD